MIGNEEHQDLVQHGGVGNPRIKARERTPRSVCNLTVVCKLYVSLTKIQSNTIYILRTKGEVLVYVYDIYKTNHQ